MIEFQIKLRRRNIGKGELLDDVKRVALQLGSASLTKEQYRTLGAFAPVTVTKAFGGWNNALREAALQVAHRKGILDEELYSNIASVWTVLGRQPSSKEISDRMLGSEFPIGTYKRRFGTWNTALAAFAQFINEPGSALIEELSPLPKGNDPAQIRSRRTSREINWRLRAKILIRDSCICRMCGDSPAKSPDAILHVDHILTWANGGETVEENLQTLCAKCNIGKSDEFLPGQRKQT